MTKIGDMKNKYGAKVILKYTYALSGLPINPKKNQIVFAVSADRFIFLGRKTGQEWVVPKSQITDIGLIYISDLEKLSEKYDQTNALGVAVITGLLIGIGGGITSFLNSVSRECLLIAYADGGENKMIMLDIENSDDAYYGNGNASKRIKKLAEEMKPFYTFPAESKVVSEIKLDEGIKIRESNGVAEKVLMEVLTRDEQAQHDNHSQPTLLGGNACLNCGAELAEGALFCTKCGKPAVQEKSEPEPVNVCAQCGSELVDGALFCSKCGKPAVQEKNEPVSVCAQCGSELVDGALFCSKCGTPAVQEKSEPEPVNVCANCGAELKAGAKFCPKCGKPANQNTKEDRAPAQSAPPPAVVVPKPKNKEDKEDDLSARMKEYVRESEEETKAALKKYRYF